MYTEFGSHVMSPRGYIVDINNSSLGCTRTPLIVTNENLICGRRMVLGSIDPAEAVQVLSYLIIAAQNTTMAIESPRFRMLLNGTIGIESKYYKISPMVQIKPLINTQLQKEETSYLMRT